MPSNGPTAKTYPTDEQYAEWKASADEMGMSVSQFIQNMVEAGRKKFDAETVPDETRLELREQKNRYKRRFKQEQERNEDLEDRLAQGEQSAIREYVEQNPGCTWAEIVQHLIDTTQERAFHHVEAMEGDALRRDNNGQFYPMESDQ